MVKKNKTRKNRKQKGGGYTKEERQKLMNDKKIKIWENFSRMKAEPLEVLEENDGIYKDFKKTIIKPGTILTVRSSFPIVKIEDRPMWLDYSPLIKKQSFLKKPTDPENLPPEISYAMKELFGPWINEMRVIKPITILHFPVNYESKEKSLSRDSYSAFFEGLLKDLCINKKTHPNLHFEKECADGYTLDFFFKEMQKKIFKGKGWYPGYREICIYHPAEFLEIYDHIFYPIEKPAE